MQIFILATAATTGGALSILKDFLSLAKDDGNVYTVCINKKIKDEINNYENFKFIYIDTKSWTKRLLFDFFRVKKIIKESNCQVCINFQNIPIKTDVVQVVYIHQSLPFSNIDFKLNSRHNIKLWLYKKFYGKLIKLNSAYAKHFVVQTDWIKNALCQEGIATEDKISVIRPVIEVTKPQKKTPRYTKQNVFFYPADGYSYKNHIVVIEALGYLGGVYLYDNSIKIVFTLNSCDNPELVNRAKELGIDDYIEYTGYIDREEVMSLYSESKALIFPSRLETFGIPLIEASLFNLPIIVSDELYSRDVLSEYSKVIYCKSLEPEHWANAIKIVLMTKFEWSNEKIKVRSQWSDVYKLIASLM